MEWRMQKLTPFGTRACRPCPGCSPWVSFECQGVFNCPACVQICASSCILRSLLNEEQRHTIDGDHVPGLIGDRLQYGRPEAESQDQKSRKQGPCAGNDCTCRLIILFRFRMRPSRSQQSVKRISLCEAASCKSKQGSAHATSSFAGILVGAC